MPQNSRTNETAPPVTDSNSNLTRRSYVRSVAAVATATASIGVAGSATADEEYELIEASGQTIQIGSGETWENKLVDMTTGQDIIITAEGSGWSIRNVGFEGENTSGAGSATFGVADTGGDTSTIENVYLGDGSDARNGSSTGHGQTAFWVNPEHSGQLEFEHVNIQGFADNAIYGSAPGGAGGGTVHIDSCFAANCEVSHYRVATEGSSIRNSSVYVDGSGFSGRGIWAWSPGTIEVENCQLEMNGANQSIVAGANGQGTSVVVSDTDYDTGMDGGIGEEGGSDVQFGDSVDTNPEAFVPEGVPTSPEEAATGAQ